MIWPYGNAPFQHLTLAIFEDFGMWVPLQTTPAPDSRQGGHIHTVKHVLKYLQAWDVLWWKFNGTQCDAIITTSFNIDWVIF